MAAAKNTELSITIKTVDQATAKLRAINAKLDAITKPTRDFKKALGELGEKSGLNNVLSSIKGVGGAIEGLLSKVAAVGGVATGVLGGAAAGLIHIANEYEDLGKKAARLGVGADFLAGMEDAAKRAGVPIEALDDNLDTFAVNIGKARAGAGRMAAFLPKISTNLHANFGSSLLSQLKAAKGNAAALDVLADAMSKLKDPAEQAALAMVTTGDAKLAPLLAKGSKGLKELRDHYAALAPGQAEAAKAGMEVGHAMADLSNATDGAKAALLIGMKPAILDITERMTKFLTGHQAQIAKWAEDIGKKLPGAIQAVAEWLERAWSKASKFVDAIGGIKNAAIGVAAIMAGPLISSVAGLSAALLTAIARAGQLAAGMGAIPAAAGAGAAGSTGASVAAGAGGVALRKIALPVAAAYAINEASGYVFGEKITDGVGNQIKRKMLELGDLDPDTAARYRSDLGLHDPLDLVRRGMDNVRDIDPRSLVSGFGGGGIMRGVAPPQNAKITIDIKNAPKGTRASVDPGSTADVDLSTGYQLGFSL